MTIGSARVSTDEQHLALPREALAAAGCGVISQEEGISGIVIERHGLSQALAAIGAGDTLVVWKLDRRGNSLGQQGAGFLAPHMRVTTVTWAAQTWLAVFKSSGSLQTR